MVQEELSQDSVSYEIGLRIRDLEENQRLTKERVLLLGQNLIDFQEKNSSDIIEIKKTIDELKTDVRRIKDLIQLFSDEIAKSARKEELAILSRQLKMFEPLKFARIEDVEKIVDEKLNKHHQHNKSEENESKEASEYQKHDFWRNKL
ncbi:MAG: hypothetical protein WC796_01650 [Candidatus Pacearchaeota archaeon]|jgi:hypothetical protein